MFNPSAQEKVAVRQIRVTARPRAPRGAKAREPRGAKARERGSVRGPQTGFVPPLTGQQAASSLAHPFAEGTTKAMSVRIRLARTGAKKKPFYRIVASDTRSPRDGRFLEKLGTYDPNTDPSTVVLNRPRVDYWLGVGARASETVERLIKQDGSEEKTEAKAD